MAETASPNSAAGGGNRAPALRAGERVSVRGDGWRIAEVSAFPDCTLLHLTGIGAANRGVRRALLHPFDRPTLLRRPPGVRPVRRRAWMRAFRALVATAAPYENLRAPVRARIDLLAYQLEPALAIVRGIASRLLLADEVGLGKTIQAGLVLAELLGRGAVEHALIVTPAGLRDQWAHELAHRFHIDAAIVDSAYLRRAVGSLPADVNPWLVPTVSITSLDFIKRPEVLRGIEPVVWDLLLIDEAHATAGTSDRAAAARALGCRARVLVLVTATPHAGDPTAFASLCDVGRLGRHDPLVMFRRSRADVGLVVHRRVRLLRIRPTREEARMHELLDAYARRVWRETEAREARLVTIVLKKRALSSAASLARSLERRLAALGDAPGESHVQLALALVASPDEDDAADDNEPVHELSAPTLKDPADERARLAEIRDAAQAATAAESKLDALQRLLRRVREPAIVFTEYRDTLARVAATLAPSADLALLHGGLTRVERHDAADRFQRGAARVLLATDAAGEGLNLQERCRLVINMELPWNPMRLEQRIGRVDRIGQTRPVHAIHLFARDTAEADVLARLVARLERVRASLGSARDPVGTLGEEVIAAAMIAGAPIELDMFSMVARAGDRDAAGRDEADARLNPPLTVDPTPATGGLEPSFTEVDLRDPAETERDRLLRLRGLLDPRGPTTPDDPIALLARLDASGPWLTSLPPRRLSSPLRLAEGLVCVLRARIVDGGGRALEDLLLPVHVPVAVKANVGRRRDQREAIELALDRVKEALEHHARMAGAARLLRVRDIHTEALLRQRDRETALAEHAVEHLTHGLVQAGLFDHRALRLADERKARRAARVRDEEHRLARLEASLDVSLAEAEVVLLLGIGD